MKKTTIAIVAIVSVLVVIILGVKINTKSKIEYYLEDLSNLRHFSYLKHKDYDSLLQNYSDNKHFKEIVLSKLNEYEMLEDPEGEDPRFGEKKATKLVGTLNSLGYEDVDMTNAFQQLIANKMEQYTTADDFDSLTMAICLLDEFMVQNEEIKNHFQSNLLDIQHKLFSGNSALSMKQYIVCANRVLNNANTSNEDTSASNSYYATVLECYPYDEMISYIKANGQPVISTNGRGGYYDGREGEYKNEHYWVDPLANVRMRPDDMGIFYDYQVGIYEYKEEHLFAGDFMVEIASKYWYMTDKSDPNNELNAKLYYQDSWICSDYQEIAAFLKKVTNTNCFYNDDILYVLEQDTITVLTSSMFSIAYE